MQARIIAMLNLEDVQRGLDCEADAGLTPSPYLSLRIMLAQAQQASRLADAFEQVLALAKKAEGVTS